MNKTPWMMALLLAGLGACTSGVPSDLDETHDADDASAEDLRAPTSLDEIEALNARPCGDDTIAVVTDALNNQYVFCALGDGRVGVLESSWDPGAAPPLTDSIPDPVALLETVTGSAADVPPEIFDAVRAGIPVRETFRLGIRRTDAPRAAAAGCNFTTFQNTYCGTDEDSPWDEFASNFVHNHSSVYPDLDCTHGNRFCSAALNHTRIASAQPAYLEGGSGPVWRGACAARDVVLSCGGSTLFEASRRETAGTGAWTASLANYWIAENTYAVWVMYADTGNCVASADNDDMMYKTVSEPGAYNHYSLFFLKWVANTIACEPR
ncbi:hypothetical protein [Chondromyces crocatus]|nr:hypothetical protein [Chondromyces crocatus]